MANRPGSAALAAALTDWRRNLVAATVVAGAVVAAAVVDSRVAYYAAALIAFAVWMGWFVLAAVDWIRRADF